MSGTDMAYVSRIRPCGCVVAATVDLAGHERETAKFVAKEVREGFDVERMTVEQARALPSGWPCEHMKSAQEAEQAQLSLEVVAAGTQE